MAETDDAAFSHLKTGTPVTVVKLGPDGTEAAAYPGEVVDLVPGWVVVRATWQYERMDLGYMVFKPDDYLLEYFATDAPFNAFALFSPDDQFKGWYCNVTHPTTIDTDTIYWHDLYVDVIQQPDGKILILDEDELAESNLSKDDPTLHNEIVQARDTLVDMVQRREYPFSEVAPRHGS